MLIITYYNNIEETELPHLQFIQREDENEITKRMATQTSLLDTNVVDKIKMDEEFDPEKDTDYVLEDQGNKDYAYDSFDEENEKINKFSKIRKQFPKQNW